MKKNNINNKKKVWTRLRKFSFIIENTHRDQKEGEEEAAAIPNYSKDIPSMSLQE